MPPRKTDQKILLRAALPGPLHSNRAQVLVAISFSSVV
jgi:hypothetical protein